MIHACLDDCYHISRAFPAERSTHTDNVHAFETQQPHQPKLNLSTQTQIGCNCHFEMFLSLHFYDTRCSTTNILHVPGRVIFGRLRLFV